LRGDATNRRGDRVRLKDTLGDRAEAITRGTIHSLCLALLREHTEAVGLRKGFGVADELYQKFILRRLGVPQSHRGPLLNRFSRHRANDYELTADDVRLFRAYAAWLAGRNMVDFDDLVTKGATAATVRHADHRARWTIHRTSSRRQRGNTTPASRTTTLCRRRRAVDLHLDRADPYVLERFRKEYAMSSRSCSTRTAAVPGRPETARRVLAHNPQLFDKQLTAERESPYEVAALGFGRGGRGYVAPARHPSDRGGRLGWGDYAVLYRKHKVGDYLEGRLLEGGIPAAWHGPVPGGRRRHQVRRGRVAHRA
jgi:hypothetical protein